MTKIIILYTKIVLDYAQVTLQSIRFLLFVRGNRQPAKSGGAWLPMVLPTMLTSALSHGIRYEINQLRNGLFD